MASENLITWRYGLYHLSQTCSNFMAWDYEHSLLFQNFYDYGSDATMGKGAAPA